MHRLKEEAESFEAGRLANFRDAWASLTSDSDILKMVTGVEIETDCEIEELAALSNPGSQLSRMNAAEAAVVDDEISKLLRKNVISPCEHTQGEVLSPIFTRQKKDGSHRMILNLKSLHEDVTYHHFKMDTLATALALVSKNCFMASLDLKDAYYSVPIHLEHRKLLRFEWKGCVYEYNALPNGLALAPRLFTKLMKPVFATLRQKGHISTAFLDDSLLIGMTKAQCQENVRDTLNTLRKLGFIVHPSKSVFQPTTKIQYLGVIIDSTSMTVTLSPERKEKMLLSCKRLIKARDISIRDLAKVIGLIVSSFPAVKFGPLHYRHLEKDKCRALKDSRGNFDQVMEISEAGKKELAWWIKNITDAFNDVNCKDPDIVVHSDASLQGWGCVCEDVASGGVWLPIERTFHINFLELKAAFFALKAFQTQLQGKHVRLMLDNTTAIACLNHMGTSHSDSCNELTHNIWSWCIDHNIFVSAAHIPGVENVVADTESRKVNLDAEWMLNSDLLQAALRQLNAEPEIDLFASRLNTQFKRFVSFRPDPAAEVIDSFSFSWENINFYAFPPFSVIARLLQKVQRDRSSGVLVVPDWPTQVWYPILLRLLTAEPVRLTCRKNLLHLPSQPEAVHRLIQLKRLHLLVCKISGVL